MPYSLRESICRARKIPRSDAVLMGRAELCSPEDRDLIDAILIRGQSTQSAARMMKTTPRVVRRRVHRLSGHLTSRKFLNAARAIPYLPKEDAGLARMAFCECLSQRKLAKKLGISCHAVRRKLDMLSARIETIRYLSKARKLREVEQNEF